MATVLVAGVGTIAALTTGDSASAGTGHARSDTFATILLNAVANYMLFTVAHDAGHHSAAGEVCLARTS